MYSLDGKALNFVLDVMSEEFMSVSKQFKFNSYISYQMTAKFQDHNFKKRLSQRKFRAYKMYSHLAKKKTPKIDKGTEKNKSNFINNILNNDDEASTSK